MRTIKPTLRRPRFAPLRQRLLWRVLAPLLSVFLASAVLRAEEKLLSRPQLFLSCPHECFDKYVRQELNYFDFARDPYLADMTLLVVRQRAGNNGERFSVTLTRTKDNAGHIPRSESFVANSGTPDTEVRAEMLQVMLRLVQAELVNTPHASAFHLSLPRRPGAELSALNDGWDYWVFAPEVQGKANGGSGYYSAEVTGALTVRRVTELSKLRLRAGYLRKWSGFRLEDGSRIFGDVFGVDGRALYAYSLGEHWALGAVATASTARFHNQKAHLHGGPLLEYNVFPYSQNANQQLRFAYQVGAWANWYFEPNRKDQMRELRPYHALSLVAEGTQYWGGIQWIGQVNSFINDPKLFRLSTGAIVSLRLFEGLALNIQGVAAYVHDQISLRKRTITDAEIVLWTAEQPTNHEFEVVFGLSYTFGSRHNTIVNPRFTRIDLVEE